MLLLEQLFRWNSYYIVTPSYRIKTQFLMKMNPLGREKKNQGAQTNADFNFSSIFEVRKSELHWARFRELKTFQCISYNLALFENLF